MILKILIMIVMAFMVFLAYGLCVAAGHADDAEEEYWRRIEGYNGDNTNGKM